VDGEYVVIVKAVNDWGSDTQTITVTVEAAPSYEGPLDLVPGADWKFAYSATRALSAAWLGENLYQIYDPITGTLQYFAADAVTGDAPAAAITAFTSGAPFNQTGATEVDLDTILLVDATGVKVGQTISGTGIPANTIVYSIASAPTISISNLATATGAAVTLTFGPRAAVRTWTDQSGNEADAAVSSNAQCAQWTAISQGGLPAILRGALDNYIGSAAISYPSGAATIFMVCRIQPQISVYGDGDAFLEFRAGDSADIIIGDDAGNEAGGSYAGLVSDTDFLLFEAVVEFGNNNLKINGVSLPENNDNDSGGPLGSIADLTDVYIALTNGDIQEIMSCDGIMSDPNRALIRDNITAKYGPFA
jgi:hypothetical protein